MRYPDWRFTPQGIDGLHVHNGYLYWGNSFLASIFRIPITDEGFAVPRAESELVKEIISIFVDKFAIGPQDGDTIWVTTNEANQLFAITPDGTDIVVAGAPDRTTLAGCTPAAFGKVDMDINILYVVTSGGLGFPNNGTITEGGKIVAIDTTGFCWNFGNKLLCYFVSDFFSVRMPSSRGVGVRLGLAD